MPFGIVQAGQDETEFPTFEKEGQSYVKKGTHKGPIESLIKPFDDKAQAEANVAERNKRAEEAGLKARYEVREF